MEHERRHSENNPVDEQPSMPESIKLDKEDNFIIRNKDTLTVIALPVVTGILAAAGYEIVRRRRKK